jgi:hypothetical protein
VGFLTLFKDYVENYGHVAVPKPELKKATENDLQCIPEAYTRLCDDLSLNKQCIVKTIYRAS